MNKNDWLEVLKKCFGKEKDSRYHAIAMLAIYGIFLFILVLVIRMSGVSSYTSSSKEENSNPSNINSPSLNSTITGEEKEERKDLDENDINYSYSYIISYNGVSEVYLGKKVDEKEKFTFMKDNVITNYAILNDNFLVQENDIYHISSSPSRFFKYCNIERILLLVEGEISTAHDNEVTYSISNKSLANMFSDTLYFDNELDNSIKFVTVGKTLKSAYLDFTNYFSSLENISFTVTIQMDFADVGKTENFEIKMS